MQIESDGADPRWWQGIGTEPTEERLAQGRKWVRVGFGFGK